MIPSSVPNELQNLTQIEEMLIARALPIMRVYIKTWWSTGLFRALYKLASKCHRTGNIFAKIPQRLGSYYCQGKR